MILAVLAALATAFILGGYLSRPGSGPRILDHPNARSLHSRPIPRTGGLAVLAGIGTGFLAAWIGMDSPYGWGIIFPGLGLALLALVSFLDDRMGVAARWRVLVHLLVANTLLVAGLAPGKVDLPGLIVILPEWITIVLTLLFAVWMINLYNFMDGMDGLAGGMAVIGFATLAWLGRADVAFIAVCLTVAAASGGFLFYNFPPAKIFLGDTGSTILGFLSAACSLWGSKSGLFPFWVAILVFSPFIVDATVTLLRRLLRGEKIWEAHRSHYYQRLVLCGWGHRRTVLAEYALMLACAGSALLAVRLAPVGQAMLGAGWLFLFGALMWGVGWLERERVTVSAT